MALSPLNFVWFDLILKVPLVLLVLLVWWAIRQVPEDQPPTDDGGGGLRRDRDRRHPLKPFPRPPRRGPHGAPAPPSPPRIRVVRARARTYGH